MINMLDDWHIKHIPNLTPPVIVNPEGHAFLIHIGWFAIAMRDC